MHSSKNRLFFTKGDFDRVNAGSASDAEKLSLVAEMVRFNSLAAIVYARSGHIGASLSASEAFAVLYHKLMGVDAKNPSKYGRDIFILSKGHAAAGQYAALASAGFIPEEKLLTFRKMDGLQGHVDVSVPGIDANTGSLGMGLSKGKGFAWAYKESGSDADVYVMVGDGELQEGQNWEAIQSAPYLKLDNLWLIVDRNMVQTDREVGKILEVAPIEAKLRAFGWDVEEVDGNDAGKLLSVFAKLSGKNGKPKAVVANTVKGKGVSFMEHPAALKKGGGFYRWHAGLPNKEEYEAAYKELSARIGKNALFAKLGLVFPVFNYVDAPTNPFSGKSLKGAFSETLLALAEKHPEIVVMDADLSEDCGLLPFEKMFPKRFIEVGIAEQDMASMAGALARAGKLPVVNTYTAILTSRANEQIFNNASEGSKVIYVGHLAGILPGKPGKSHQGVRDISLLRAIPGIVMCAPCNAKELDALMAFIFGNGSSAYLRLEHPAPRKDVELPVDYRVEAGKGCVLADGKEAVLIGYGPLMLSEALIAREMLAKEGVTVRVVGLPWLNGIDEGWLSGVVKGFGHVFCLENHSVRGGQGEEVRRILSEKEGSARVHMMGVDGFGTTGDNEDMLRRYGLDSECIAEKVRKELQ